MSVNPIEVITTKRDGGQLSVQQIRDFIAEFNAGRVADEQAAALLMAIFLNGATDEETIALTQAMIDSGQRQDLSGLRTQHGWRGLVDKHSTGGVGDKITLILTPLLASFGLAVPQLSGRGLGHTGGTLDKLEAIPGFRSRLNAEEYYRQLAEIGAVVCAAGDSLAPVDGRLYALRDVTGTVESIPLIAASIMSKKIAEGTEALMLDVKVGSGAFMKDHTAAHRLAELMITIGEAAGVHTRALLTRMDTPLGLAVGNVLEVEESLAVLRGGGPADVRQLTIALAQPLLAQHGIDAAAGEHLDNGAALAVFERLVQAQGGDLSATRPLGRHRGQILAERSGTVHTIDALAVGQAAWRLGAGRSRKEDPVQFGAGVQLLVQEGAEVQAGEPLADYYSETDTHVEQAAARLAQAFAIGQRPPRDTPLILAELGAETEQRP